MAETRRVPVFGSRPPSANYSRLDERSLQLPMARLERPRNSDNQEDFVRYEDSDGEEKRPMLNTSYNFVDYIRSREYGMREFRAVNRNHATRHCLTHNLFKEWSIPLITTMSMKKVLCSQWLSTNQIIFGTSCNKLMVYNVNSYKLDQIPLIKQRINETDKRQCGIHSLRINPSRTLLATGAYSSNKIAVYRLRLPTLDPIVLAKGAHKDFIFDIEWIDDEFFVSSSVDNKIVLWQVQDTYRGNYDSDVNLKRPVTQFINHKALRSYEKRNLRFRAIKFNKILNEMFTLSLNGYVHVWDVDNFKQIHEKRLYSDEGYNCIAMKEDGSSYAVGCKSYLQLLDSRNLSTIIKIPAEDSICGIFSLSFLDNLITIGTGVGVIRFYDIRAEKYLESSTNSSREVVLKTSTFYDRDETFRSQQNKNTRHAVFTHCYDHSRTRLFSAGGPILEDKSGIYARLWQ